MKDAAYFEAIEAIATYLASLPLNCELHKEVVADLWTRVADIRDEKIAKAKEYQDQLLVHPDLYRDARMRENVKKLGEFIAQQQGEAA